MQFAVAQASERAMNELEREPLLLLLLLLLLHKCRGKCEGG